MPGSHAFKRPPARLLLISLPTDNQKSLNLLKPITQIACLNIILVALLRLVHAVLIVREHVGLDIAVRRLVARVALDTANSRDG
jgi:hypothetical protein